MVRRKSPFEDLQEEIKRETDLNSSMNKKRLREAQEDVDIAEHLSDFNSRELERINKLDEECLSMLPSKRQKTSQSAAWKSSNVLDDSLASHKAYLKEMNEFVNKKPGAKGKRPLIKM